MFLGSSVKEQDNYTFEELETHKVSFRCEDPLLSLWGKNKDDFFRGKRVALFVSVGQAYHEKGKFLATIKLLNKYPFASCDIMMADTLQRYNHLEKLTPDTALLYTRKLGDLWLKRNAIALDNLQIPHTINRWDSLLNHEKYSDLREKIDTEYHRNSEYKNLIHENAHMYIERLKAMNPSVEVEQILSNALQYLIEEFPIVMPLWAQMGYDFIVYPKPMTPGMRKTCQLFVEKQYENKCQWLFLRFKKR